MVELKRLGRILMTKNKQQYGQYMTPELISDFMVSIIKHDKKASVLEPSCGDGSFLLALQKKGFLNVDAYEIDSTIVNQNFNVNIGSFVSHKFNKKYDVIIGNPPYIRWKNLEHELKSELSENSLWNLYCNSLCDYSAIFIIKAIELLDIGGELIFITPEYWLSTTHSQKMRNYLLRNGNLEEIYHFNETPIFDGVNVSLIIFRFVKGDQKSNPINIIKYFSKRKLELKDIEQIKKKTRTNHIDCFHANPFKINEPWILARKESIDLISQLERSCTKEYRLEFEKIGDYCDIGNGMVSGLDKAFQIPNTLTLNKYEKNNTIDVLKAKDLDTYLPGDVTKYIFLNKNEIVSEEQFLINYPNFAKLLEPYREHLIKRYNYGKNIMYWNWVFLRNYKLFSKEVTRIYVPCKERITNKNRVRFCFGPIGTFPTQDVTGIFKKEGVRESIQYLLAFLNSKYVFQWLLYKGIRKGDIIEFSEKPISSIPFRAIDFTKVNEKRIHDIITEKVSDMLESGNTDLNNEIAILIDELMGA